jgi:hypothetical protein
MGSQIRPHNPEKLVPGLSSWVLSAVPSGLIVVGGVYPFGRPFGTAIMASVVLTQTLKPKSLLAVSGTAEAVP